MSLSIFAPSPNGRIAQRRPGDGRKLVRASGFYDLATTVEWRMEDQYGADQTGFMPATLGGDGIWNGGYPAYPFQPSAELPFFLRYVAQLTGLPLTRVQGLLFAVGPVVAFFGQSEIPDLFASVGALVPLNPMCRQYQNDSVPVGPGVVGPAGQWSVPNGDGARAYANRVQADIPNLPLGLANLSVPGTTIADWTNSFPSAPWGKAMIVLDDFEIGILILGQGDSKPEVNTSYNDYLLGQRKFLRNCLNVTGRDENTFTLIVVGGGPGVSLPVKEAQREFAYHSGPGVLWGGSLEGLETFDGIHITYSAAVALMSALAALSVPRLKR